MGRVANAIRAGPDESQETRAQAVLCVSAFGLPVLAHDEELALAWAIIARRTDGVHSLLDRRHKLGVLLVRDAQGLELCQVVCEGQRAGLSVLEVIHLAVERQLSDLYLLLDIHSKREQFLQKLPRRLPEEVEVIHEEFLHRRKHHSPLLVWRRELLHRDDGMRINAHLLHEGPDHFRVVRRVNGQGLALAPVDGVFHACAGNVDLEVEASAVVVGRRQELPIGHTEQLTLRDVGARSKLGLVFGFEGEEFAKVADIRDDLLGHVGGLVARRLDVFGHGLRIFRWLDRGCTVRIAGSNTVGDRRRCTNSPNFRRCLSALQVFHHDDQGSGGSGSHGGFLPRLVHGGAQCGGSATGTKRRRARGRT
mmetsp:Transcript_85078/g.237346  ORF Transcript_85078/g.237346 Transcript_85078/m.237346 type:complete len:365 (+) Transcript_85078:649-1743(+)